MADAIQLYNTLTRRKETFVPLRAGEAGMYVCGMTIYDYCHVGHARMMMAFDVVQRWLRVAGYKVTYVQNITDIDDKIIKRAIENGETITQLTERMTRAMDDDIQSLGIQLPDVRPRATQYVPQMLQLIDTLAAKGLAYQAGAGDVNFAVRRFAGYGRLSGKSLDELRAGERIAVNVDKQDPLDFVLWKRAKPDEPPEAQWPSRWGDGRPGWHIECSAMSCAILGERFDIHGGGSDLQFPHHENEIAQSEGASGHPFVNYWLHNGFLNVDNEKMSKSLGNFFTIRDVLATLTQQYGSRDKAAEVMRFFLIRTHYRSPFNYSDAAVDEAKGALTRLYTALHNVRPDALPLDWAEPHAARFRAAMNDDFNTPEAFAALFDLASEVNRTQSARLARQLVGLGATLALLQHEPEQFLQGRADSADTAIDAQIAARHAAKKARDFALADRIRAELLQQGIVLEDKPGGVTQWRRT
ncbi:MAG: cysteine--tRNA ligase [Betaproteobacteria bacterium]|nr:cysteine--tRNA ligase [Betaproteobacteria bacterium]